MTPLTIYLMSILLGAAGAWLVSRFADWMGLLDCPNERSSHRRPTPRGGGVGILGAFLLAAIVTGVPLAFWLPLSLMSGLAFWGDRISLSPQLRLSAQLILSTLIVIGAGPWPTDHLWWLPWLIFWSVFVVGTANIYNFMDGINGISGITGIIGFGLLAGYFFFHAGETALATIAICISLACLGFLPFNLPAAKVFLGDVGSILLGSVFAGFVFLASKTPLDFVCLASFLFTFYADELTTMFVRLRDGENLTQAHRRHIYQLLANEKGIVHWKISIGYGFLQLFISLAVTLIKPLGILAVLLFLTLCFLTFAYVAWYFRISLENSFRNKANLQA